MPSLHTALGAFVTVQCDDLLTPGHLWACVLRMDMAARPGLPVSLPDPSHAGLRGASFASEHDGLSEAARATQTPDLSLQYHHSPWLPPCYGVTQELGSERAHPDVEPAIGLSACGGWAGGAAGGFGQDS